MSIQIGDTMAALREVMEERVKQHEKWGLQRHPLEKWLAILVEEVGEFAQAIQRDELQAKDSDSDDPKTEITQVAAVATAILEQIMEEIKDADNS